MDALTTPGPPSSSHGLPVGLRVEPDGASGSGTGPAARAGKAGAGISLPSRRGRRSDGGSTHDGGARPGQLAPAAARAPGPAGKEYRRANGGRAGVQRRPRTPTAEGAARVLNPRWPRRADDGRLAPAPAARAQAIYGPARAWLYAVCFRVKWRDWRTPGAARDVPRAFTMTQALLLLTRGAARGRRQLRATRHRTPARLRLSRRASFAGPGSPSQLDLRVAGPGVWPGGGGSSWERDRIGEAEPWVTTARRIAGRLSPAGLRLATSASPTVTVAVRSRHRRCRRSRARRARE